MAGHDYSYRSGYSTGNGVGSYTDQWGQTRYANAADNDECGGAMLYKLFFPLVFGKSYVTKFETRELFMIMFTHLC